MILEEWRRKHSRGLPKQRAMPSAMQFAPMTSTSRSTAANASSRVPHDAVRPQCGGRFQNVGTRLLSPMWMQALGDWSRALVHHRPSSLLSGRPLWPARMPIARFGQPARGAVAACRGLSRAGLCFAADVAPSSAGTDRVNEPIYHCQREQDGRDADQ